MTATAGKEVAGRPAARKAVGGESPDRSIRLMFQEITTGVAQNEKEEG